MSRYTPSTQRPIYQAILAAFVSLSSISAYAVNIGQASVQSEQHEPLVATIAVNNIDAKNFNASLASNAIYQQMGLEQTAISVQFVPTSDTAGRILLTSSQPISAPFTDIVLNIDNNGEQHIEPQTLLMPLPKQGNVAEQSMVNVAAIPEQNLPIAGGDGFSNDTQAQTDLQPPMTEGQTPSIPQNIQTSTQREVPIVESTHTGNTNNQQAILTEQITRKILPAGTAQSIIAAKQAELANSEATQEVANATTQAIETQPSDSATYVVQSGDNLWKIANEIAKANNISVSDVMKELHNQNPDAFNNNNINRLKANATLRIANYEVIPSQKAISEAIAARTKASKENTKTSKAKASNLQTRTKANSGKGSSTKVAPRPLPKPQVTLVTPSKSGSATGSTRTASLPTAGGGSGGDLVANLKNTRVNTAETAKKVNGLNQELSSATQKLQLQNKKLAELEARLKALKEK